jgi:hypothetical protein
MILESEILMGREKAYPLTEDMKKNLSKLLLALNVIRKAYGKQLIVTSGYRPGNFNSNAGGAKASSHMSCEACDFRDTDGNFAKWCLQNLKLIRDTGLRLEDPRWTRIKDSKGKIVGGWVHLQTRSTKKLVFIPSSTQPMVDSKFWNGKYDSSLDKVA